MYNLLEQSLPVRGLSRFQMCTLHLALKPGRERIIFISGLWAGLGIMIMRGRTFPSHRASLSSRPGPPAWPIDCASHDPSITKSLHHSSLVVTRPGTGSQTVKPPPAACQQGARSLGVQSLTGGVLKSRTMTPYSREKWWSHRARPSRGLNSCNKRAHLTLGPRPDEVTA